jgi:hypothetical protein
VAARGANRGIEGYPVCWQVGVVSAEPERAVAGVADVACNGVGALPEVQGVTGQFPDGFWVMPVYDALAGIGGRMRIAECLSGL